MSGGGTNYRKKASFSRGLLKIRLFFKKLSELVNKNRIFEFHLKNFGGILIEFAFSIPVVIVLMYFVHDHYRFYELKSKVKTTAYLAASMIQQLGNLKTNKKLTHANMCNIYRASFLNFIRNTAEMSSPWPLSIRPYMDIIYVKRNSSDSYYVQAVEYWANSGTGGVNNSTTSTITKAQLQDWIPDMVCDEDGDERVLVLPYYYSLRNLNKNKAGFFIMPIKEGGRILSIPGYGTETKSLFKYEVIFTPKPGLFPIS